VCLAVPGKIVDIRSEGDGPAAKVGIVDFQGTRVEVGLAFTPDAGPGDWVLVHAGYALNVLDEREAAETWQYLREAEVVDEVPGGSP